MEKVVDECAEKLKAAEIPFVLCAVIDGKNADFKDAVCVTDYYSIGERMALLMQVIRKYAEDSGNLPIQLFASELLSYIIKLELNDVEAYKIFGDNRKVGSRNENN